MLPRSWAPLPPADAPTPQAPIYLPEEWNRATNFMNKPVRGWLHPDQKITESGICYGVRYIGCLEVNTSMKSLDFDTRSMVAKECINKLCEAAGLKTVDKKRKVDKRLLRMIAESPNMNFAGSNVSLTITSSKLNLVAMESGEVIANHEMPNISFASGGDADTLDFVSYVAKDHRYGRACFVLECGGGLAQDVITTIGQAFELRYKQFLMRAPSTSNGNDVSNLHTSSIQNGNFHPPLREDPDYYNDLPNKLPPDATSKPDAIQTSTKTVSHNDNVISSIIDLNQNLPSSANASSSIKSNTNESLIDFAAEVPNVYHKPEPEYVNTTAVIFNERLSNFSTIPKSKSVDTDVFDMEPLCCSLPAANPEELQVPTQPATTVPQGAAAAAFHPIGSSLLSSSNSSSMSLTPTMEKVRSALLSEPWFHGTISRKESEALVIRDGDFLVRESQGSPGQYVLSGMQNTHRKHLLLVDPEGVIRTKDQIFESISHLIRYHMDNALPIVSAESALLLRTPVYKLRPVGKSIQV